MAVLVLASSSPGEVQPWVKSSSSVPSIIQELARGDGVTRVERIAGASDTALGVFTGVDSAGRRVIAVGSVQATSPFALRSRVDSALAEAKIDVVSAASGGPDSVDSVELAGIAAPDVARIEVVSRDGTVRQVPVTQGAFTYGADRADSFPASVLAYDDAGRLMTSRDILAASPPALAG